MGVSVDIFLKPKSFLDIEKKAMEFTLNFCPTNPKSMCPLNLSVGKEHCKSQAVSNMLKMDQMYVKTQPIRFQCDYASDRAGNLGEVIWAMPERNQFFSCEVFPYHSLEI